MDARWPIEIGGIEPIAHLGAGGFGQVWLANQTNLDRKVAVKISHIPFATDDDKRRFDRECRALGQLGGHPHIIEVHTSGESNGLPYLVLQYVDGGTLADHGNALSEAELRRVMDQLCQAVGAAHERGVLHRDLKPENVFLQKDGTVILGDFGIARLGDGNVTDAAGVTGSMAFVAPRCSKVNRPRSKPMSTASPLRSSRQSWAAPLFSPKTAQVSLPSSTRSSKPNLPTSPSPASPPNSKVSSFKPWPLIRPDGRKPSISSEPNSVSCRQRSVRPHSLQHLCRQLRRAKATNASRPHPFNRFQAHRCRPSQPQIL